MANEITVSVGGKSGSVNVSSGTKQVDISITKDLSAYYSALAKDWAIKTNGVVENTDYSAKYYANEAASSANEASNYSKSSQEIYDGFQQATNDVLSSIETSIQDGVDTINNNTDVAITGIKTEAQKQIQNIESTGFYVRDDKLYFINSKGDEEEFKSGGGSVLFDTKLTDHILTYEQTKGWALQGTYVYKEAVAGSRYGYPDFYNKCVEEKDLATPTETVLGENTITLYTNANGHTFYDIADKEAIDAWYSTYGIAWYYGIDKENERIFLPRTKWFIQPSGEITEVNTVNEAGLPNITGEINRLSCSMGSINGAFNVDKTGEKSTSSGASFGDFSIISFDASRSNQIYGNSDTVQPPSINQLLYICVGNTNIESAVTDVVDVTTTENDTVPLGYSTYQNGIVPNTSWLKSQGQWNDGNVYTTFYNEFVQKIGQSFASGYVKEITEEYDDYDLVINQDDMTFRLPLLDGSEDIVSDRYDELELLASSTTYTAPANGWFALNKASNAADQIVALINKTNGICNRNMISSGRGGYATIPVKRGDIVTAEYTTGGTTAWFRFIYAQGNGSLYFKVANAVQNLELLDAGEVLESLADKISRQDCKAYITETYQNGTSWYRVYSDGWCDMGGKVSGSSITFPIPFTSLPNVSIGITTLSGTTDVTYNTLKSLLGNSLTVNGFNCGELGQYWRACGYIS